MTLAAHVARFVGRDDARTRRVLVPSGGGLRLPDGASVTIIDYFGVAGEPADGPQGHLTGVPAPDGRVGAHFHDVDQFQVFFPVNGAWYLRQDIEAVLVHYADAYTTYGPFGSRRAYLPFLTLRARAAQLTGFMPGARSRARHPIGRNRHASVPSGASPTATATTAVLPLEDDSMAAFVVDVRLGDEAVLPDPLGSGGQYVVVLEGKVILRERTFPALSLGWVPPLAAAPIVRALDGAARLLVLQFPIEG